MKRHKLDSHSWQDQPLRVVRDVGLGVILFSLCSPSPPTTPFFHVSRLYVFDVCPFLFGPWTVRSEIRLGGKYLGVKAERLAKREHMHKFLGGCVEGSPSLLCTPLVSWAPGT